MISEEAQYITDRQKQEFIRNGFVVIDDAISDSLLERVRDSFWESLPVERGNPESWLNAEDINDRPVPTDIEAHEQLLREIYPYAEALVGDSLAPPEHPPSEDIPHANHIEFDHFPDHDGLMAPFPNFPTQQMEDNIPKDAFDLPSYMPHLDSGGSEYYDGFTIVAGAYIDPVGPQGGGYTTWPGSHKVIGEYFEDDMTLEQLYTIAQQKDNDQTLVDQFDLGHPFEVTGDAGTIFLTHPALVHTKGPNLSKNIRKLCYCKLSREDLALNDLEPLGDIWAPFENVNP